MLSRNYSRYAKSTVVSNNGVLRNGLRTRVDTTARSDDIYYTVRHGDRVDTLAYKHYGRADLWWILADYNDLMFPLVLEIGSVLRIPSSQHVYMDLI